jgi:hypothetical protein
VEPPPDPALALPPSPPALMPASPPCPPLPPSASTSASALLLVPALVLKQLPGSKQATPPAPPSPPKARPPGTVFYGLIAAEARSYIK